MLAKCPNCKWKPPLFDKEPDSGAIISCPRCKCRLRYTFRTRVWGIVAIMVASITAWAKIRRIDLGLTANLIIYAAVTFFFILAFMSQKYELLSYEEE